MNKKDKNYWLSKGFNSLHSSIKTRNM